MFLKHRINNKGKCVKLMTSTDTTKLIYTCSPLKKSIQLMYELVTVFNFINYHVKTFIKSEFLN